MEGISNEIRSKIKAAVKAKLQELGVHVDEELPDYILVMVANRRTKAQMCGELSLFLGSHTENFTDWLHLVFQKLEAFAPATTVSADKPNEPVDQISHQPQSVVSQRSNVDKEPKKISISADDKETHDPPNRVSTKDSNSLEEIDDDCLNIREEQPLNQDTSVRKRRINVSSDVSRIIKKIRHSESNRKQPSSQVGSVVRPVFKARDLRRSSGSKTADYEKQRNDKHNEEHTSQHKTGITSVVRVTARPKLPPRMQANKSLILKAVAAAQKSVAFYQPKTKTVEPEMNLRPELFTRNYRESKLIKPQNVMVTVTKVPSQEAAEEQMTEGLATQENEITEMDVESPEETGTEYVGLSQNSPLNRVETPTESVETRFIVTLDGIDAHFHPGKHFSDEMEDDEMEVSDATDNLRTSKSSIKSRLSRRHSTDSEGEGQQQLERCKYWPSCRQGDHCSYHHPNVPCKTFPNCTFGDSCLFIHPNCKYDAACSRKKCPFTHSVKPKAFGFAPVPDKVPSVVNGKTVCKFFPSCNNVSCVFFHPLACKFGSNCTRGGCTFYHPKAVPSVGKLKWVSNK